MDSLASTDQLQVDQILRVVELWPESDHLSFQSFLPAHLQTTAATAAVAVNPVQSTVLAQQFDQDILGDLVTAWTIFIQSGQVWALIIGIIIGYLIRNLTAY